MANPVRLEWKWFPRVTLEGSQTARQQWDSLRERSLARIVGSNEDGQGSEFHLGAPGIALIAFQTKPSEFHANYMIPGVHAADGAQRTR